MLKWNALRLTRYRLVSCRQTSPVEFATTRSSVRARLAPPNHPDASIHVLANAGKTAETYRSELGKYQRINESIALQNLPSLVRDRVAQH
jgi:hypothetical protein